MWMQLWVSDGHLAIFNSMDHRSRISSIGVAEVKLAGRLGHSMLIGMARCPQRSITWFWLIWSHLWGFIQVKFIWTIAWVRKHRLFLHFNQLQMRNVNFHLFPLKESLVDLLLWVLQGWTCSACQPPTTLPGSLCSSQVGRNLTSHTENRAPPEINIYNCKCVWRVMLAFKSPSTICLKSVFKQAESIVTAL